MGPVRRRLLSGRISRLSCIAVTVIVSAAGFRAAATAPERAPTFAKDVAPILFKHCVSCHQPGGTASNVSLLSYDAAKPWAPAIKKSVAMRRMPPWPADPKTSAPFRNDNRLSAQEIRTLAAWADAQAPRGKDADLPPAPKFAEGWLHPQGIPPDAVISLAEVEIPATGEVPYMRRLAKVPFPEDKWIAAIQVRPSNPRVVHHLAITEVALDPGLRPADIDALERLGHQVGFHHDLVGIHRAVAAAEDPSVYDMLGVYTPGTTFEMYQEGAAKLLKAGDNLYVNVNVHYQSTGKPEKDRLRIAFWFQPQPPKQQLFRVPAGVDTIIANGRELLVDAPGQKAEGTSAAIPPIPPGDDNYELIGITAYTRPVTLYQFQPHAHERGKDFQYIVVYDDGREQSVLNVPKYEFHWQLAYELRTPLQLPAGSKLVVKAHYDNSRNNPNNPAPDKSVHFLEGHNQSSDEMFTPFVQYAFNEPKPEQPAGLANVLEIAQVDGCLEPGPAGTWMLSHATEPVASKTQATTSVAVKAATDQPLGDRSYRLLGVRFFHPERLAGQRVAVKGVLMNDKQSRLNVTSLQTVAATCAN